MNIWSKFKHIFAPLATEKALLTLLLAISVAINPLLSYGFVQNRNLVQLLNANRKLTVGEIAPVLKAHDEKGQEVMVDLSGRQYPTILYLQSATCHWCEQNTPNLRELALQAPSKYHLITLLLEPAIQGPNILSYPNAQNLFDPSTESKISFDLYATPMTILFSPEGKVEKIWKGAYHAERKIDIEMTLGIQLPGLPRGIPE